MRASKWNYTEKLRSYSVVSEERMIKWKETVKNVLEIPKKYELWDREIIYR